MTQIVSLPDPVQLTLLSSVIFGSDEAGTFDQVWPPSVLCESKGVALKLIVVDPAAIRIGSAVAAVLAFANDESEHNESMQINAIFL